MEIGEPMRRRDVLNPRYSFRSAITGRFVGRLFALMNKDVTVRVRVR